MKNYYEKELLLPSGYSDPQCKLGLWQAALLVQDGMTEMFHQYDCDAPRLSVTHGAVWAVVRSKIYMDRSPIWMERVRMRVFPVKVTAVAVHINLILETMEGETLMRCRQELCAIDVKDHTLRRVDSTSFPTDLELLPPVLDIPCLRMRGSLDDDFLCYRHLIRTSDVDMNHHMNNVAYVRLLLDTMPSEFWESHPFSMFDIHYLHEGREGETLDVLKKQEEKGITVHIRAQDRTLIKAFLETT